MFYQHIVSNSPIWELEPHILKITVSLGDLEVEQSDFLGIIVLEGYLLKKGNFVT